MDKLPSLSFLTEGIEDVPSLYMGVAAASDSDEIVCRTYGGCGCDTYCPDTGCSCDSHCPDTPCSDAPAPPAGSITSVSSTVNSITVRYSSISGASSYEVAYRKSSVSTATIISNGSSLSCTITGLTPNTEYVVNYRGISSSGKEGAFTSGRTISTKAPTPASFSISSIDTTSITLRITVGSSSEFIIYCTTPAGKEIWNETVTRTSNFNYTINGLIPNTAYKVNVHYDVGNAWCGTKDFTTASARPSSWAWWSTISQNQSIGLSAGEWNAFCVRINEFRDYKGLSQYGAFVTARTGADISAATVNHAVWAIGAMNSGAYSLEVSPGDTITADFFNGLKNYLNAL